MPLLIVGLISDSQSWAHWELRHNVLSVVWEHRAGQARVQEVLVHQMWKCGPQTKPRGRQAKGLGASAHYVAPGWFLYFN